MKRTIPLILLLLLLCGCTAQPGEETVPQPSETTGKAVEPTEPAGIYEPFSDLEIQTGGAVRCFLPKVDNACGLRLMGGDVLVFSGTERTVLTRYTGEKLFIVARVELDCLIDPEDTAFQISENGITYFNYETYDLIFLDNDLKEVRRLRLPAGLTGKPVLSSDRTQVYYCTADAIRVYDTVTGLDKLLKSISYPSQSVHSVLEGDAVLRCDLRDSQGRLYVIFISTQTGQLVSELSCELNMTTGNGHYYVKMADGVLELVLFGQGEEEPQMLSPADAFAKPWILKEAHGVITASVSGEEDCLDYYDLSTGKRTARVELPGGINPMSMECQGNSNFVWLLAKDEMMDGAVVLRWDRTATPADDEQVYTGPRYTAESPDTEGLAACAALAQSIGDIYGVEILLGQEAIAQQPWDYTLEYEYQVSLLRRELEVLDDALAQFPEGFFEKLHGKPRICIVRSVTGNAASGSLDSAKGIQFWVGEDPYIVLAAGESLEQDFYHELFHIIDTKVLSVSRVYYHWDNLNPEGCKYFEDYTSYRTADVSKYLQDEDRVFIDAYSMSYPREDRARIMEYACMPGNAHYFTSDVMQNKLEMLCEGIRKAFGLEKVEESFLWEQYLNEPLT